jgi:putative transposase
MVLGQARSMQHYEPKVKDDEERLKVRITALATQFGRYGYKMITGMLKNEGWRVNHKRVARIWRQEGLKVSKKQPKRRRLWLNDGSCVRLRALAPNHVWTYDFVSDRTHDGRPLKMLTIVDEFTRESLAIEVQRQLRSEHVIEVLADLFISRGPPAYLRSDNGSEFTAALVRNWLAEIGVQMWRKHYNQVRPHSSLGYKPPAPEAVLPFMRASVDDQTTVGLTH